MVLTIKLQVILSFISLCKLCKLCPIFFVILAIIILNDFVVTNGMNHECLFQRPLEESGIKKVSLRNIINTV